MSNILTAFLVVLSLTACQDYKANYRGSRAQAAQSAANSSADPGTRPTSPIGAIPTTSTEASHIAAPCELPKIVSTTVY